MDDVTAIRVPDDFETEFPGASASAAEVATNLVRTADALIVEFDRRRRGIADLSASAFQALAILEGADEPLAAHVIAERLLVSSASVTSLLDTLERRGLVERRPHPDDRRKVLVHLTGGARDIVDRMLPAVHAVSAEAVDPLTVADRERLVEMLTAIRAQLAAMGSREPSEPLPRRTRRG